MSHIWKWMWDNRIYVVNLCLLRPWSGKYCYYYYYCCWKAEELKAKKKPKFIKLFVSFIWNIKWHMFSFLFFVLINFWLFQKQLQISPKKKFNCTILTIYCMKNVSWFDLNKNISHTTKSWKILRKKDNTVLSEYLYSKHF